MASSQVEITTSPPFGCILRDHNRRDGCRESNGRTSESAFRLNLKDLVRDRIRTRISASPGSSVVEINPHDHNNTSINNNKNIISTSSSNDNIDSWIVNRDKERSKDNQPPLTQRQSRVLDRWAAKHAREMVSTIERQSQQADLVGPPPPPTASCSPSPSPSASPPPSSASGPNRGASSLVQIWEARLGRSTSMNNRNVPATITIASTAPSTTSSSSSRSNSPLSYNGNASLNEDQPSHMESLADWEPDQTSPVYPSPSSSSQDRESVSNAPEGQRPRVADLIRRLIAANARNSKGTKNIDHATSNVTGSSPSKDHDRDRDRDWDHDGSMASDHSEQRGTVLNRGNSPRDPQRESDHAEQREVVLSVPRSGNDRSAAANQLDQGGLVQSNIHPPRDHCVGSEHSAQRGVVQSITHSSLERPAGMDQSEPRAFVHCINHSPRLRGRQAWKDLLVLIERDRKKELENLGERRAVSRFTQKGRIQALLKLKILQRGLALQDQWRPYSGSTDSSHSYHSSTKQLHIREKFAAFTADQIRQPKNEAASSSSCWIEQAVSNASSTKESSSIPYQKNEHPESEECRRSEEPQNISESDISSQPQSSCASIHIPAGDVHEEVSLTSNLTYQDTSFEASSQERQESAESYSGWYQDWTLDGEEEEEEDEDEADNEEEEALEIEESSYDWFLGVSRPRSYWEGQRQAWYQEMLEKDSTSSDIRQLLERRTVSTFLTTSDLRDKMNNLMVSHIQKQTHSVNEEEEDQSAMSSIETMRRFLSSYLQRQSQSHQSGGQEEQEEVQEVEQQQEQPMEEHEAEQEQEEEEEEEEEEEDEEMFLRRQERMEELMSNCLQVHANSISSQDDEEEEEEDNVAEEEEHEDEEGEIIEENDYEREDHDDGTVEEEGDDEEISLLEQRYPETNEYLRGNTSSIPMSSRSLMRSWSYRSRQVNHDHDQVASPTSRNPHSGHSYYQDAWQHFNSINRLSMEMELINDLRSQMKQLYQEMSELRTSINSCLDMQVKLQDSIKQEMITVRGERTRPEERTPRKGNCCICYEMKVDSLLYRCGHMCTCLKCAHELQMGSGKCPICRAPIVDVVKAYTYS